MRQNLTRVLDDVFASIRLRFAKQSFLQKVLYATWQAKLEIECDGFHTLFCHDYEFGDFVVTAYETIGAIKSAEICKQSLKTAFPDGIPTSDKDISRIIESLSPEAYETLNSLSNEFIDADDIDELLYQFVLKHPDEFGSIQAED